MTEEIVPPRVIEAVERLSNYARDVADMLADNPHLRVFALSVTPPPRQLPLELPGTDDEHALAVDVTPESKFGPLALILGDEDPSYRYLTPDEADQLASALSEAARQVRNASEKCPRCDSPQPNLHPAVQHEGEVQVCPHSFHEAARVVREGEK